MPLFIFILLLLPLHLVSQVTLIWQVDKKGICETDWLKELLSGLDYTEIDDGKWTIFKDRAIIVVSNEKKKKCKKYFDKLSKMHYKFGVIQLGDEFYSIPADFYEKCSFALRHYWHERYGQNVAAFPLGYKQGFLNQDGPLHLNDSSHRKYVWSFAGQIEKSTRIAMINSMKKVPHYFIHETKQFFDPNALPSNEYRELLLNSIFIPCPRGWANLESFRIYEALECGCIPLVEKGEVDYFEKLLGDYPFPSLSSWDEAPFLIRTLLANPMALEELRCKCALWWKEHKKQVKNEIHSKIQNFLEMP